VVRNIEFSERQEQIIEIVKKTQPITSENIANKLDLNRSTLRPDLSILTMSGILEARPRVGYFFTGRTSLNLVSEKINKILVEEIQSVPVVLDESTSIYDAIVFMFLEDIGSIYITDNGFLSGVVSRKDIIKTAIGKIDLYKTPIGFIMTRMPNIIHIDPKETVINAARKLIDKEIDSLPVVKKANDDIEKYKVVGRITKTNITNLFVELGTEE
jgi:DeoR family transcriptional regulator, catabolite repression regulator